MHSPSTTASPPFNDPNADVILRSSDGVHFYTHKSQLSLCSSFFEGMFTIANHTEQESHDKRPCIPVSDDSRCLGLLSWCDPRCMRSITSLDDIRDTLEMADKYGMDFVSNLMEKTVLSSGTRELMESDPVRLIAIAVRFRLEKLSLEAAKKTLRMPLTAILDHEPIHHDFKYMNAFTLRQLLDYHVRCTKRAQQCIDGDDLSWARTRPNGSEFVFAERRHNIGTRWDRGEYVPVTSLSHGYEPGNPRSKFSGDNKWVGWWNEYMDKVSALLSQTPYGQVAQTPSLLGDIQSVITLGGCGDCKKCGYEDLVQFSVLLSEKIDEVVSQVPFYIEY